MKLHINKSLRLALIACAAVAAQAVAASVPAVDDYGNIWLSENTEVTTDDQGKNLLIHSSYDNIQLSVAEKTTVGVTVGGWNNENKSFVKTGEGTLQLTGVGSVIQNGSPVATNPKNVTINDGTLDVTYSSDSGFVGENVTVNAGGTLMISSAGALGGKGTAGTDKITLKGSETETANLVFNAWTPLTTDLYLQGNTVVTGTNTDYGLHNFNAYGGKIYVSGTNNTIENNMVVREEFDVDVAEGSSLTINGSIKDAGTDMGGDVSDDFVKTGAGTLVLGSNTTVDNAIKLNINEGALDLSDVTTLNASELNLASGTTLVLGDQPVTITGSLTLGETLTIDLRETYSNRGGEGNLPAFEPFTPIFTYAGDGTFDASEFEGVKVTIKVSDFTNTQGYLTVSEDGKSLLLVPEPTTATLSLLALAGLAARRRRK